MIEHKKARAWMEANGMDRHALAERIGYTAQSCYWMLRGEVPPNRNHKSGNADDREIKPWVWQRFKRACGDLDAELNGRKKGQRFDW